MKRQWIVGGGVTMWARAKVGETERVKAEWKLEGRGWERERKGGRAKKGDHSVAIQESDETLHEWQFLNTLKHTPPQSLPFLSCDVKKTATRIPSSHGKCKEKQGTVRKWILLLNKSPSLSFFEWVLKIQSWQSAHGPWMEKDKRGAEVGGLSIVFVPFLLVLAL